jgi:hypothetical protein
MRVLCSVSCQWRLSKLPTDARQDFRTDGACATLYARKNGMVTQRPSGSVESILGRSIRRYHPALGPGAEAAGLVELRFAPFALAAGEYPPLRD